MRYDENTKLLDILRDYPALADRVAAMDPRFAAIKTPLGRMMLKGKTVADLSKLSGFSVPELLNKLEKITETL